MGFMGVAIATGGLRTRKPPASSAQFITIPALLDRDS